MIAVDVRDLAVRFGPFAALDGVTFQLDAGSITGLVGPNGSGKTTLLRVIATLLVPTAGRAAIHDLDVVRSAPAVRALIGYLPDFAGIYQDMRVEEYLDFFARAHGLDGARTLEFRKKALDLSGLTDRSRDFVENLSRGMRARLSFVRALAGNPRVLVLDEPLSNLDPVARQDMVEILKSLRGSDTTILVSSHILTDLEKVCDRALFLDRGRLVSEPAGADSRVTWEMRVASSGPDLRAFSSIPGVVSVTVTHEPDRFLLVLSSVADAPRVLAAAVSVTDVVEWKRVSSTLEQRLVNALKGAPA